MTVFSHSEFDQHEQVVFGHDSKSGLKAIIAIHNTNLGPALGGCRMWNYASDEDALTDVLRLSRGMSYKSAISNLKLGGGKSVIIGDPRRDKTDELLLAMGEFVDSLSGRYVTAEDSGTGVADIAKMGEKTRHICGVVDGCEHGGDPSPSTALGVYVGLRAAVHHRLGGDSLDGLKVAIQGVGSVGYRLGKHLTEAGAQIYVADVIDANVARAVEDLGAIAVESDRICDLDVDVFAPCAMGAVLNDRSIGRLRARVVAGAANNQLAGVEHGEMLRKLGILYTPDYVINAGGVIDAYYQYIGSGRDGLRAHIESIGDTLADIFARAEQESRPTNIIADAIALERMSA